MGERPELCWYCQRAPAEYFCDFRLGTVLEPADGPPQLRLGETPPAPREMVATCDAAACLACAQRHGWRRVDHICARPVSKSSTIDHCHVHVGAGNLGETGWVGGPAIALLRRDVRIACVRAGVYLAGGTGR